MLATASRDRLIHVFDVDGNSDEPISRVLTLDEHSGSVTRVRFLNGDKALVSCSSDLSIFMRRKIGSVRGSNLGFVSSHHNLVPSGSLHDLDIDPSEKVLCPVLYSVFIFFKILFSRFFSILRTVPFSFSVSYART